MMARWIFLYRMIAARYIDERRVSTRRRWYAPRIPREYQLPDRIGQRESKNNSRRMITRPDAEAMPLYTIMAAYHILEIQAHLIITDGVTRCRQVWWCLIDSPSSYATKLSYISRAYSDDYLIIYGQTFAILYQMNRRVDERDARLRELTYYFTYMQL